MIVLETGAVVGYDPSSKHQAATRGVSGHREESRHVSRAVKSEAYSTHRTVAAAGFSSPGKKPIIHVPPARLLPVDKRAEVAKREIYNAIQAQSSRPASATTRSAVQYESVRPRPQSAHYSTQEPRRSQTVRETYVASTRSVQQSAQRPEASVKRRETGRPDQGNCCDPCPPQCWCSSCAERDAMLRAKAEAARREKDREKQYAQELKRAADAYEAAERQKHMSMRAAAAEDADFNRAKSREAKMRKEPRINDMGDILANRVEGKSLAETKAEYSATLEEQIAQRRRDAERELQRNRAVDARMMQEARDAEAQMKARDRSVKLAGQEEQRRALEEQIRYGRREIDRAYDGADSFLKLSDAALAAEARAARARELQAEQVRLMEERRRREYQERFESRSQSRQELLDLERKAEEERLAKERAAHLKKQEMKQAWADQKELARRRAEYEKSEWATSNTGLIIGSLEKPNGKICCRCGGPMPDGCMQRVHKNVPKLW